MLGVGRKKNGKKDRISEPHISIPFFMAEGKYTKAEDVYQDICLLAPSLTDFVHQVRAIPQAQPGEKKDLLKRMKQNDQAAFQRMIEIYMGVALRTAYHVAIKYDADLPETVGIAMLTLSEYMMQTNTVVLETDSAWFKMKFQRLLERKVAPDWMLFLPPSVSEKMVLMQVREYLEKRGLDWSQLPYLSDEIKQDIVKTIKFSAHIFDETESLAAMEAVYLDDLLSPSAAADFLHVSENDLYKYYDFQAPWEKRESLQDKYRHVRITDLMLSYEPIIEDYEDIIRIRHVFCGISPQCRLIIAARLGLDGEEPLTLQEIGDYHHVTRERIRQLESKGYKQIKNKMNHALRIPLEIIDVSCDIGIMQNTINYVSQVRQSIGPIHGRSRINDNRGFGNQRKSESVFQGKREEKETGAGDRSGWYRSPTPFSPKSIASNKLKAENKPNIDHGRGSAGQKKKDLNKSEILKKMSGYSNAFARKEIKGKNSLPQLPLNPEVQTDTIADALLQWLQEHPGFHLLEELTSEIDELQKIRGVNLTRMVRDLMGKGLLEMKVYQSIKGFPSTLVSYKKK